MKYSDEDDNQNSTTFTRYATTMVDYFEPPCELSTKNEMLITIKITYQIFLQY